MMHHHQHDPDRQHDTWWCFGWPPEARFVPSISRLRRLDDLTGPPARLSDVVVVVVAPGWPLAGQQAHCSASLASHEASGPARVASWLAGSSSDVSSQRR